MGTQAGVSLWIYHGCASAMGRCSSLPCGGVGQSRDCYPVAELSGGVVVPAHVALVAYATAPTLQGEEQLDYGTDHVSTEEESQQQ